MCATFEPPKALAVNARNNRCNRIAFVISELGLMDVIAVPTVAALAKDCGWETSVFVFEHGRKDTLEKIKSFAPDIIAYSVCSNESVTYHEINRTLQQEFDFFALFGGHHPTFYPDYIQKEGVDALYRGEAYGSFRTFLRCFGESAMYEVDNLSFKMPDGTILHNPLAPLIHDYEGIPFPARDLIYDNSLYLKHNPAKPFVASRGCPYSCTYCYNSAYKKIYKGLGQVLHTKDVDYLLAEIDDVRQRFPLRFVRFQDDIFGTHREWLREFSEKYPKRIGLPFGCYARADMVTDEYVRLLHDSGCSAICIALECGNEHLRQKVLNRHMSNATIIEAIKKFRDHNIRVMTFNMIGIPLETEENLWETVRLNQAAKVDHAHVCIFQAYPGTEAYDFCVANNMLTESDNDYWDLYSGWSSLNFPGRYRQRLYVMHKLFPMLVDHPRVEPIVRLLLNTTRLNKLLEIIARIHFGFFAYRNVYHDAKIPIWVRIVGALTYLRSKGRT